MAKHHEVFPDVLGITFFWSPFRRVFPLTLSIFGLFSSSFYRLRSASFDLNHIICAEGDFAISVNLLVEYGPTR